MATVEEVRAAILANPTRYQRDGQWLSPGEIATLLCTGESIPNPVSCPMIPRTINLDSALAAISNASLQGLVNTPLMSDFIAACKAGDVASAKRLIEVGVRAGKLQEAEAAALLALNGEIPDPTWQPFVTGPPPITTTNAVDVAAALEGIAS